MSTVWLLGEAAMAPPAAESLGDEDPKELTDVDSNFGGGDDSPVYSEPPFWVVSVGGYSEPLLIAGPRTVGENGPPNCGGGPSGGGPIPYCPCIGAEPWIIG